MSNWNYSGWCDTCGTNYSVCLCKPPEVQAVYDQRRALQAIVDQLPKCWGLRDGTLVQDVPVVPGMKVWFRIGNKIHHGVVVSVRKGQARVSWFDGGCESKIVLSGEFADSREAAEQGGA